MNDQTRPTYIYLDSKAERKQLVLEIARVRRAVLRVVDDVPESEWYEPRYHGWSLAAMLGHLNLSDNITMLAIKAALIGIRPSISRATLDRINNFTARLFRKRVVPVSIKSIEQNEERIADFIMTLPMRKFSTSVFDPDGQQYTTVERLLQDRFLYHWEHHLQTMREVEGIQPPERTDKT